MSEPAGAAAGEPPRYVCEVVRRGKFAVAERIFEPAGPLALGRRGSVAAEPGDLVVVEAVRGRARVVERLGPEHDVSVLLRGLLVERAGARAFADELEQEARRVGVEPDGLDAGRVDLRDLVAFTVDPPDARDFDDAISIAREDDGVRVQVHIADVAHHVVEDGAIDREARRRALSVYVPGQVEPMLPHALSSGACSLQADRDRRAVTVELELGPDLRVRSTRFSRSLIRSRARLDYGEAQEILEGRASHAEVGSALHEADRVAAGLRTARFARGALAIVPRELEIGVSGGRVSRARWQVEPRAHALVEEFMILANEAVAGHLARLRRPALYRVHEPPDPAAVELLVARLADLGVPTVPLPERLETRDAAALVARQSARLEAYLRGRGRRAEGLSTLVLRAMSQARYDPRNLGHAGLASPAYCHFTSPIRRYPDLVCQRALCASIGLGHPPAGDLDAVAAHASGAERAAADVERSADDLCLASLLVEREHGHEAGAFPAEVTGLIGAGLFVRFGEVYEGFLPSRRLDAADRFDVNELGTALVGRANGRRYRLADELEVEVTQVEVPRGRVTLDLAGGARQRPRPARPGDRQRQRPRPRPGGRRRR